MGFHKHGFWRACYEAGIKEPEAYICKLYTNYKMSCKEIAEHFNKKELPTSVRNIEHYVNKYGIIRSKREARKIAISKNRVRERVNFKDKAVGALEKELGRCRFGEVGLADGIKRSIDIIRKV